MLEEAEKEERYGADFCRLVRGKEMDEGCVCEEETVGGDEVIAAASLIVLDAGNSSGDEGTVRESAVKRVSK